jgi:hypothetical protein
MISTFGRGFISVTGVAARTVLFAAVLALLPAQAASARPVADFTFSPASPLTGETVTFTSQSTGIDQPERWDLDGDRICDDAIGPTARRSYSTAGVYSVTLCVSDTSGQTASQAQNVPVGNRLPVAAFNYAPGNPMSGDTISLTSISADPDGPITSQAWDLDGDGVFDDGTGAVAFLPASHAGNFPIALRVTDRDGATAVATATIDVAERPPGAITPFPVVSVFSSISSEGTRLEQLVIRAPDGARVKIRCRGGGCPFDRLVRIANVEVHASKIIRIRRFAKHRLRPGAIVQIWVMKRGQIGKYTRFRIRRGKPPARADRCLMPGAKRPVLCPGS